ncbi:glycosyltransferase family 4 protein [Vibrio hepatarius]|uniref:glycosyltransferase family 4 protein n=1 Tax=Vibrio hepatarius TaxID=171383 RepID=UPI001C0A3E26|nr:glycosyltransferase family 4 protein [Vibrio hepatarius]MBU2898988.1 glycosyltransferase family 4 protein [Vibrio hepatarius]
MPNKVWLLIDSLTFGGIDAYVIELAKGLKQHRVDVEVLLIKRYAALSPIVAKLEGNNINFSYLSSTNSFPLLTLLKRINHRGGDIIHAHGYKSSLLAKCARIFTGITQVSTYHAGEIPKGKVKLYDLIDRYSAFCSSVSLSVSEQVSSRIPTKTRRLNNFIHDSQVRPNKGNQIAFVGRLSHEKAPDRFIHCAERCPKLDFHIYGSGPMETEIIQSLPNNITFHGHQANMDRVWEEILILVICSRFEGMPMAALEAMAKGCIVIAYDVGDLSKLINHGKNGFIVNSLHSLVDTLQNVTQLNKSERQIIQKEAAETIQQGFSSSSVIPQMLNVYLGSDVQSDSQFDKTPSSK